MIDHNHVCLWFKWSKGAKGAVQMHHPLGTECVVPIAAAVYVEHSCGNAAYQSTQGTPTATLTLDAASSMRSIALSGSCLRVGQAGPKGGWGGVRQRESEGV